MLSHWEKCYILLVLDSPGSAETDDG